MRHAGDVAGVVDVIGHLRQRHRRAGMRGQPPGEPVVGRWLDRLGPHGGGGLPGRGARGQVHGTGRSRRCRSARAARVHSATSADTKAGTNVSWTTPPLVRSRCSSGSATLRGWSLTDRAEEWLKITGAVEASSASRCVDAATWDRSTRMPSRLSSVTIARPTSVRPPTAGLSVAESAQAVLSLWVSVRYRTPSRAKDRSTPSEPARLWPPSTPISDAMRPSRMTRSVSAAVYAIVNVSGYVAASR
ncbi:hypothetical protein GCM10027610_059520 [Dactylosporangium cerinum]